MYRYLRLILIYLAFPIGLSAQAPETIRVCTYNVLQFGGDDTGRIDEFRQILNSIRPTLLTVQGLNQELNEDYGGVDLFTDSVAAMIDVPLTPFVLWSSDSTLMSYSVIFIDTNKLTFLSASIENNIQTPREQPTHRLQVKLTGEYITFMTGHWEPGNSTSDRITRGLDALEVIRGIQSISPSNHQIFAGSINVYTSGESAYQTLLYRDEHRTTRLLFDPIDRPGEWYNNAEFAELHTQSTRARQFGGGSPDGMRGRFDHILISKSLLGKVRADTYMTFGNDGLHFRDSINSSPNLAVSQDMAQALHDASDHLPVYVDFVFGSTSGIKGDKAPYELDLTMARGNTPDTSDINAETHTPLDMATTSLHPGYLLPR